MISFVPGEATEEQAFDIVGRFAQEYLGDKYEAVYAVHNDKEHMHGHIVFNSVSFETGAKYDYRKGEWKRRMQPLTNKLCAEYGLNIMPAEYAKEPKNLSRKEWELEQTFREMILADAEFCQSQATSFDHFVFLMKRIGYQFEYGKYLSIKVPGGRWYHQLDKLNERFAEDKFRLYLDIPYGSPRFVVKTTGAIYCKGTTAFQMKFYRRIYQARMVEQRRIDKHAAYLAKELERMNRLQEQYLFLVKYDIKSVEGLIGYQVIRENEVEEISKRQKTLYQENSVRKRACKTVEDIREYQLWHMDVQAELDALKAEKKELNKNLKLVEACKAEYKTFSRFDYTDIEDEIRHSIEVPEYPYAEKKVEHYDDYAPVTEVVDNAVVSEVPMEMNADKKKDDSLDVEATSSIDKITYEEYKRMTPLENIAVVKLCAEEMYDLYLQNEQIMDPTAYIPAVAIKRVYSTNFANRMMAYLKGITKASQEAQIKMEMKSEKGKLIYPRQIKRELGAKLIYDAICPIATGALYGFNPYEKEYGNMVAEDMGGSYEKCEQIASVAIEIEKHIKELSEQELRDETIVKVILQHCFDDNGYSYIYDEIGTFRYHGDVL